jgi:hypothetical protein
MALNNTACSPTSNCTILDGAFTNGTVFVAQYDPSAAVPHWHQRMELATICVFNSLTCKQTPSMSPMSPMPITSFYLAPVQPLIVGLLSTNKDTVMVIIARLWYRRRKMKRFKGDDKWMIVAGVSRSYREDPQVLD